MTAAPTLFDLEQPIRRATWSTIPCHACGQPIRRFVRQNPAAGWFFYELDHTAWAHLRAHSDGRLLLRISGWGLGPNRTQHTRSTR